MVGTSSSRMEGISIMRCTAFLKRLSALLVVDPPCLLASDSLDKYVDRENG